MILLVRCATAGNAQETEASTPTVASEQFSKLTVEPSSVDAPAQSETVAADNESAEAENSGYLHSEEIPLSYELQEVMQEACEQYSVPYSLALAIAERESNFDLDADNGICVGIMQIHPINYERLRSLGIEPTEYEGNIIAGVYMIGELLDEYGDVSKALMAYNCGESGASQLWEQGYTSSEYSRQVMSLAEKWQGIIET